MNAQAPQNTTIVDQVEPPVLKNQAGDDVEATDEVPGTAGEVVGATGVETGGGIIDMDGVPRQMEFVGPVLGSHERLAGLFNTFRMGTKWGDVEPFEMLDLVVTETRDEDSERHTLTGDTVVLAIHQGELGDMIELHAGLNHGCEQAMPADRRAELHRLMQDAYGYRRSGLHQSCVVVYMHRSVREEA